MKPHYYLPLRQPPISPMLPSAEAFGGEGLWVCPMRRLTDALEAAWAKGRTPLLVDATDTDGGFSALESFYSYSGHQLLEMKKLVVQVGVTKEKTVEQALAEAREKLILSMKRGYNLVIMCANSAPPIKTKFSSPATLPYVMLEDNRAIVDAHAQVPKDVPWLQAVVAETDELFLVHKDFQVVVVTKFSEEDYAEFLGDELPLDKMQHIKVISSS